MTNKTSSVTRKHCNSTEGESHQMPKIGFLHLLRWVCSKLHYSFTTDFTRNSSIYTEQCTTHCFFTTSKSHKAPVATHSTTVASFATLF